MTEQSYKITNTNQREKIKMYLIVLLNIPEKGYKFNNNFIYRT